MNCCLAECCLTLILHWELKLHSTLHYIYFIVLCHNRGPLNLADGCFFAHFYHNSKMKRKTCLLFTNGDPHWLMQSDEMWCNNSKLLERGMLSDTIVCRCGNNSKLLERGMLSDTIICRCGNNSKLLERGMLSDTIICRCGNNSKLL